MKKISAMHVLKRDIQQLEDIREQEWILLKKQLLNTYESLKPLNILKSTLNEAHTSQWIKNGNNLGHVMGFTAGFLSNMLLPGTSFTPVKGIFSKLLQIGVTRMVTKNAQTIKLLGTRMSNFITGKG